MMRVDKPLTLTPIMNTACSLNRVIESTVCDKQQPIPQNCMQAPAFKAAHKGARGIFHGQRDPETGYVSIGKKDFRGDPQPGTVRLK